LNSYAFVSYQTDDKVAAGQVKRVLGVAKIDAFLAHEDIEVSVEWRLKILEEIGKANIFICLLSANYRKSPWCMQESGIAAFRNEMTIIPLSLDGTKPTGFIANFQAVPVDRDSISIRTLIPAFFRHDFDVGVELTIDLIGKSGGYRAAEENFQLILPYIARMSDAQVKLLLDRVADNGEVHHASLCARDYVPPLLKSHGRLLSPKTRSFLRKVCAQYAKPR
jgi:TIR domain